jgi:hypothetical protein
MRSSTLEYYSAYDYEILNNEFHEYKQSAIAELAQYKSALSSALTKRVDWQESYGYDFEDGQFYILYNSHNDKIFYSVGPPSLQSTHFLLGNNIPKP